MATVKVFESDNEWLKEMADATDLETYDIIEILIEHWKETKGESSIAFFG